MAAGGFGGGAAGKFFLHLPIFRIGRGVGWGRGEILGGAGSFKKKKIGRLNLMCTVVSSSLGRPGVTGPLAAFLIIKSDWLTAQCGMRVCLGGRSVLLLTRPWASF